MMNLRSVFVYGADFPLNANAHRQQHQRERMHPTPKSMVEFALSPSVGKHKCNRGVTGAVFHFLVDSFFARLRSRGPAREKPAVKPKLHGRENVNLFFKDFALIIGDSVHDHFLICLIK